MMREMAHTGRVHHREIAMYQTFFDELLRLKSARGIEDGDLTLHVADKYYVHVEEFVRGQTDGSGTAVLIQDLTVDGFRITDKMKGCDDDHVRIALTALANYHALTIATLSQWKDSDGKTTFPAQCEFLLEKTIYDQPVVNDVVLYWIKYFRGVMERNQRPDVSISISMTSSSSLVSLFLVAYFNNGFKMHLRRCIC